MYFRVEVGVNAVNELLGIHNLDLHTVCEIRNHEP